MKPVKFWQGNLHIVPKLCLGISALFTCDVGAQSPGESIVVVAAHSPILPSASSHHPVTHVHTSSEMQEQQSTGKSSGAVPTRIPDTNSVKGIENHIGTGKSGLNFFPVQRPIGQVNIGLKSKPKGETNIVPEDLAPSVLGEVPVVLAASMSELRDDSGIAFHRRHDHVFPYQPLYFEEANLERYGRTCGSLQPAISGARFFGAIVSLPYTMTQRNPHESYFFKWPHDAGWGAPRVDESQPIELKPALVQAGVVTGLFFVVP